MFWIGSTFQFASSFKTTVVFGNFTIMLIDRVIRSVLGGDFQFVDCRFGDNVLPIDVTLGFGTHVHLLVMVAFHFPHLVSKCTKRI